jgi:hypothetical protein
MRWDSDRFKRIWTSLAALMRSLDWYLIALIACFVLVVPIPGGSGPISSPLLSLSRLFVTAPFAAYENALAAAALKRREYQRPLATIDTGIAAVNVVTFRRPGGLRLQDRDFDIWVALGSEVRDACVGAADPVRTLQQILGLPPVAAENNVVTELEVPPKGLFRPCVGRSDIGTPTCDFELPNPPAAEADSAALREAYGRLRFMTQQMWDSYRIGFLDDRRLPLDYPYKGFPFTGMGWTYNWGSSSPDHFGVSEFVVKRDAVIRIVGEKSPANFCAKAG